MTEIAVRATDTSAFISVLAYYALPVPAYAAGHLALQEARPEKHRQQGRW